MPTRWCLRLEDLSRLWISIESIALLHLKLPENLTDLQAKHLSYASPENPIRIEFELGEWDRDAFYATVSEIHMLPPVPRFIPRRRPRTMVLQ